MFTASATPSTSHANSHFPVNLTDGLRETLHGLACQNHSTRHVSKELCLLVIHAMQVALHLLGRSATTLQASVF